MSDFEEMLKADRARLDRLQAPQDMEERLRQALRRHVANARAAGDLLHKECASLGAGLQNTYRADGGETSQAAGGFPQVPDGIQPAEGEQVKGPEQLFRPQSTSRRLQRSFRYKVVAASVLVLFVLAAFNFDAIAYYGRQLLGYEQVMNGTLRQLSELGKGQYIGKSYTFSDGVSLTVDYVMLDDNQLLLFYSIKVPEEGFDGDYSNVFTPRMFLSGSWGTYHMQKGEGRIDESGTEIKWIASFEVPKLFDKHLTLHVDYYEAGEGKISFTLDRSLAMGHTLKKELHQKVKLDETTVELDSILASPTQTVVKGSIPSKFSYVKDYLFGEPMRLPSLELKLIANGQEIQVQGGGTSTGPKGITFQREFDALPADLTSLQLEIVSFTDDHPVDRQFPLNRAGKQELTILGQTVEINKIERTDKETLITISSDESVVLTKVALIIDGQKVPLEEITGDDYQKTDDGRIIHTRTLRFLGSGEDLILDVQRMSYAQTYNRLIDIPLD